jgi:MFS family permease
MMSRVRLLLGISVFWLGLSMLSDGLNTLILPIHLFNFTTEANRATILGLLTFVGLLAGLFVQPIAGLLSDQLRQRWGRRGTIGLGLVLILLTLFFFALTKGPVAIFLSYATIQVTMSLAQAAQQGFIPDLVPTQFRGTAAGLKGFMDVGGALLGFAVLGQLLVEEQTNPAIIAIGSVLIITFVLAVILVREPVLPESPLPTRVKVIEAFRLDLHHHRSFAWLVASRFLFLLGTYAVGRFFLFFVADRLSLDPGQAAEEAGALLAGLTLTSVLAAPLTGWMADRWGRVPMMLGGAALSALGVLLLIQAENNISILIFGGLMALGSAAFAGANWALTADLAPPAQAARFFGLANIGTAGAAAAAGLLGPLVDRANGIAPESGYTVLFVLSALAFLASAFSLRRVVAPSEQLASNRLSQI